MTGTLLFGGTDLASVCIVEDLSDFWSSSDLRGDLPEYPGVSGAKPIARPVTSKICSGQVTVAADTLAAIEDGVATVKALLRRGVSQTATRRKVTGAGNLDATQTVIVRAAEERWLGGAACTLLLSVEVTDGVWYGASEALSAPGTVTAKGDDVTRKMTITLAAGAARTVTNTTNGYWFTFPNGRTALTTVPTGGVLIDVVARTATAITGGADLSDNLSWGKAAPLQLEPGSNVLTVSSGTASISYQPAYL